MKLYGSIEISAEDIERGGDFLQSCLENILAASKAILDERNTQHRCLDCRWLQGYTEDNWAGDCWMRGQTLMVNEPNTCSNFEVKK